MEYKEFKDKVNSELLRLDLGQAAYEAYESEVVGATQRKLSWEELIEASPKLAFAWCKAAEAVHQIAANEYY